MVSIGPKIQITGESAYRQALNRIISETKELNSEMDLMVAKFSKADSAIEKNKQKQEMLARQIDQSKKEYDKFREGLSLATKKHEDAQRAYDENQKALQKLNEEQQHTSVVIKRLANEFGEENKYVEAAKKHYDALGNEIKETEEESETLSKEVDRSGKVMADWQTKVNQAELEFVKLKNELRDLPQNLQIVGEEFKRVGDAMASVGDTMTKYLTAPMVAATTATVKWASDFTDGMAKIYTIAEESEKPMSQMREELINLSNASGYSLEDLAEAEYQAVSASVETGKAVDFLTDATRLARGGFTSTTRAVDLLTTVINAYGYEAEDAAYISDVLLRTQNDGKTIIDELAGSMGTVIPTAANYNVSLEQLAAAYATMTKQGVNTSRATTFLNAMFTELEKSSSTISKTLDAKTGKSFAQLMGEGKSLAEVLSILYDAVDQDNEQFQRLFGNIRSGKAASALLTDDFGILNKEVERMSNALGQTDHAMAVLETPSLKAKRALQQLKNSSMELGTQLMDRLAPTFEKVVTGIKNLTDYVRNFTDKSWDMVIKFGAIVAATGPLLTVLGKVGTAVGGIMTAIATGTLPLTTTIGLIVGITEALGGLFVAGEVMAEQRRNELTQAYQMTDYQKQMIDNNTALQESYLQTRTAIQEKEAATLGELSYAEMLVGKYNELIDSNGQIKEGYSAIAETYLNELASVLGMEYDDVVALIDANGQFGQSIYDNIEAMRQRAIAEAYMDLLTEAIKRQATAEDALKDITQQWEGASATAKIAQEDLEAQQKLINDTIDAGLEPTSDMVQRLTDLQAIADEASAKEAELGEAVSQARNDFNTATADMQNAEARLSQGVTNETEKQTRALWNGSSKMIGSIDRVVEHANNAKPDGSGMGVDFVSGFINGISSMVERAANMAAYMAQRASGAARANLSINSPSKVTEQIGQFFGEGFAVGIEDRLRQVQQASTAMTQSALNGIQMSGYDPQPTTNYSKTVSAPISINLTIEGNVDGDDRAFAQNVADSLVNLINRKSEVFA